MISYPTFIATLVDQDVDLDALAVESGVDIVEIHEIMNGRKPPSLTAGAALADVLGVPAKRLWALPPDLESVNARLGKRRYITDPETSRIVNRATRGVA